MTWRDVARPLLKVPEYHFEQPARLLAVALLADGHALVEDVPGVGKTILARAFSRALDLRFTRVQGTPDLLPGDVTGSSVLQDGAFRFIPGPIFTNVLLVDEVNRATPRTQSALLEAMGEGRISVEGRPLALPDPFLVIATENPVEFEGTFPLPEAQKDRFFLSLRMGYPPVEAEEEILEAQRRVTHPVADLGPVSDPATLRSLQDRVIAVEVPAEVEDLILRVVEATRRDVRLQLGASPRASLALYRGAQALAALRARGRAEPADVRELASPVLGKRIVIRADHQLKGLTEEAVVAGILERVATA
ncbi:MAG: AAA family ATPase [Spirochaetes bacterium]|nr:AAA family ATPase [Spirochaetota bacterium]